MKPLTLSALREAVAGQYAAIRRVTTLQPLGEKVYPPTYEGGQYAVEKRRVKMSDGSLEEIDTVLLDSVQSQANRMELALLRAYDEKRIQVPMVQVDFAAGTDEQILKEIGRMTALEAPHRICDAIFRDSELDGKPFRESNLGSKIDTAKASQATALLELCPTALLLGFWDSTGPRGGLGAKLQRALVSEIVGYAAVPGCRPSSRIDPLQIENNVVFYAKADGRYTFDESEAVKNPKGEPKKLKPSEVNHGNITPSIQTKDRKPNHGGVTISHAVQHVVLSLAALRRLRFPVNGAATSNTDIMGRTLIAALGLVAICLQNEDGYDLRSRCLLDGEPGAFEFVGRGATSKFSLDRDQAATLLSESATEATKNGLPWPLEPVILKPSNALAKLVTESRKKSMAEELVEA